MLAKNRDLFAWTTIYMLRINPRIISHKLSICKEAKPIAQNKRRMGRRKGWLRSKKCGNFWMSILFGKYNTPCGRKMWYWLRRIMDNDKCVPTTRTLIRPALRMHTHYLILTD